MATAEDYRVPTFNAAATDLRGFLRALVQATPSRVKSCNWCSRAHVASLRQASCSRRAAPRALDTRDRVGRTMSSAVAHALPPSVLALFAPRPPIPYKPPIEKRKMLNYTTLAQFVQHFEDPKDTPAPEVRWPHSPLYFVKLNKLGATPV